MSLVIVEDSLGERRESGRRRKAKDITARMEMRCANWDCCSNSLSGINNYAFIVDLRSTYTDLKVVIVYPVCMVAGGNGRYKRLFHIK